MNHSFFLTLLLFLLMSGGNSLAAQQSTMNQPGSAVQRACAATNSGDYVTIGHNNTTGSLQILHFNNDMRMYRSTNYNLSGRSVTSKDIRPAADLLVGSNLITDGYWVTGDHSISGVSDRKMFVMRVSADGHVRWFKETTGSGSGAQAIIPVGMTAVFVGSNAAGTPTLTCFNNSGTILWGPFEYQHPRFTLKAEAAAYDVTNNQIIVTGSSQQYGEYGRVMTFAINASTGETRWFSRHLFSSTLGQSVGTGVAVGVGTSIAVTGYVTVGTNRDILSLNISQMTGQLIPNSKLLRETATSSEEGHSICFTNEGIFIAGRCDVSQSFFVNSSTGSGRRYPRTISTSLVKESVSGRNGRYLIAANTSGFKYHNIWVDAKGQSACSSTTPISFEAIQAPYTTLYNDHSMTRVFGTAWTPNYLVAEGSAIITQENHTNGFNANLEISNTTITTCMPAASLCGNATLGEAPYSYQWSTGSTARCLLVSPTSTTNYGLTVRDATGCSAGFLQRITVSNLPSFEATDITANSLRIRLVGSGSYTDYQISYRRASSASGWITQTVSSLPATITGLSCNTWYNFSIRARAACGTYTTAVNMDVLTAGCSIGDRGVSDRSSAETQMETSEQVLAFPNPTNGVVNLNLEKFGKMNDLHLFSAEGKLLENITVDATTYTLDMTDRPSGIYFVRCNPENGAPQMVRIVRE